MKIILPAIVLILTLLSNGCRTADSETDGSEVLSAEVTKSLCLEKATNDSHHILLPERRQKLKSEILTKCLFDNGIGNEVKTKTWDHSELSIIQSLTKESAKITAKMLSSIPKHVFDGIGCILTALHEEKSSSNLVGRGLVSCRKSRLAVWSAPSYVDIYAAKPIPPDYQFQNLVILFSFQMMAAIQQDQWSIEDQMTRIAPHQYDDLAVARDGCFQIGTNQKKCTLVLGEEVNLNLAVKHSKTRGNEQVYGQDFELVRIFNTPSFQAPDVTKPWLNALPK